MLCPKNTWKNLMIFSENKLFSRCSRCKKFRSIKINTYFENKNIPCSTILKLGYPLICKTSVSSAFIMSRLDSHTVVNHYKYFRLICSSLLTYEDQQIGGDNIEVQINETKFDKVKYHRGHRV